MENGETSSVNENTPGIDQKDIEDNKVWGILAYIIFFLPLLTAPDSRFAKFHANQGLLLVLLAVANIIIGMIPVIGLFSIIISLGIFVLWLIGIINAAGGKVKPLPLIGNITLIK